jgi:hypothetical protein
MKVDIWQRRSVQVILQFGLCRYRHQHGFLPHPLLLLLSLLPRINCPDLHRHHPAGRLRYLCHADDRLVQKEIKLCLQDRSLHFLLNRLRSWTNSPHHQRVRLSQLRRPVFNRA